MTGLLEICKEQFGSSSLYEILGVDEKASANELKKGYHKVSLKVHPDRVKENEKNEATQKFQTLGKIYQILSDNDLRSIYDETGKVPEEDGTMENDKDWQKYWRNLFKKLTISDIINFEKEYIGSNEELKDLESAYIEGKGDMDFILMTVLLCTVDDEPRFREIIDKWIEDEKVESFPAYTKETDKKKKQRKRKAMKEAEEAEVAKKELGLGDSSDDLKSLILSRGKDRAAQMDSFLDDLANKYAKPTKKNKRK